MITKLFFILMAPFLLLSSGIASELDEYKKARGEIVSDSLTNDPQDFDTRAQKMYEKLNFLKSTTTTTTTTTTTQIISSWVDSSTLVISSFHKDDKIEVVIKEFEVHVSGFIKRHKKRFSKVISIHKKLTYKTTTSSFENNKVVIKFLN